jgi:hypothetical protein
MACMCISWFLAGARRASLLVDPTVDLAKVRRDLLPAPSIVPLTELLPKSGASRLKTGEEDMQN